MLVDTLEITNRVFEALKTDAELSGYMAQFSKGGAESVRNRFPFLLLEYPSLREKQLLAASGIFVYRFEIYAGVKSLAPGVAYQGSESGGKGICDICHDIVEVIKDNSFSGTFFNLPVNIRVDPKFMTDNAETTVIGKVSFDADVWFKHR